MAAVEAEVEIEHVVTELLGIAGEAVVAGTDVVLSV